MCHACSTISTFKGEHHPSHHFPISLSFSSPTTPSPPSLSLNSELRGGPSPATPAASLHTKKTHLLCSPRLRPATPIAGRPHSMGASRFFLPVSATRALFVSLAMAAVASGLFRGAGAWPSTLPRPRDQLLDASSNSISAAPSSLPTIPRRASAPDVMPILPTPLGAGKVPPAGSMPIIPSNPSPPEPDQFGPTSALAPVESSAAAAAPSSAAASLRIGPPASGLAAAGAMLLLLLRRF